MKLIIDIPEEIVTAIQNGQDYRYDIHTAIAQGKPCDTSDDLISREALLKEVRENKELFEKERVYLEGLLLNAPTVEANSIIDGLNNEIDDLSENLAWYINERNRLLKERRLQGDLTDEVWKLYKKHQSHLATYVLEFGNELADLLGKYNEGGAEE